MAANTNRYSTHTSASGASDGKDGDKKKEIWSTMLNNVAKSKRLPVKTLIVLGGTVDSQRDLLEGLSIRELRQNLDRHNTRIPPVANSLALGYTYYDVLDADQEDILARISLYLLTTPSPSFASLLQPLLTPRTIPNTLIVILLDWSQPWSWMRQLRQWILLLRSVIISLSDESKTTMEEVMVGWRKRGRGGGINLDGTGATTEEDDAALPQGPGEWDDALGLPLCVIAQNAEKMEILEKTQSWKEDEFDLVQQYMRTVLLRHGASLIYTTPNLPSPLPGLVHSSLGIHSLLKRDPLKPNTIDRDKILVPPNWDSWSKIRVLRDGFDVEAVSKGWSIDLDQPLGTPEARDATGTSSPAEEGDDNAIGSGNDPVPGSAVTFYERAIHDPGQNALAQAGRSNHSTALEVETTDTQVFLEIQMSQLENLRNRSDRQREEDRKKARKAAKARKRGDSGELDDVRTVNEHIGPVQFNMGGIQVDADDMVERIKNRHAYSSDGEIGVPERQEKDKDKDKETVTVTDTDTDKNKDKKGEEEAEEKGGVEATSSVATDQPPAPSSDDAATEPVESDNYEAFFQGLMNRRGAKAG